MLRFALGALVLGLIAGVLGFGGIAGASVGLAKMAFFAFIVLSIVFFVLGKRPAI